MKNSTAIITGINGQDGSFLADYLLSKKCKVYGLVRRTSRPSMDNCKDILSDRNLEIVEGDLTDLSSITRLCQLARADYFFNTAAQSHVWISFKEPIHTAQVTGMGALNCLEAIRLSGIHTRFLQCSSSEMFGGISPDPGNEDTYFHPRSPYGVAKLFAYWITRNYRESYKMFACNAISYNHESARRPESFVSRKITMAAAKIKLGLQDKLYLGNLDAKRDWGHAPDFCEGFCDILFKTSRADDYVLASGETHSVREFCELAFSYVNLDYKDFVEIDPRLYRPAEVDVLVGDYSKIHKAVGWRPKTTFNQLVKNMMRNDLNLLNLSQKSL